MRSVFWALFWGMQGASGVRSGGAGLQRVQNMVFRLFGPLRVPLGAWFAGPSGQGSGLRVHFPPCQGGGAILVPSDGSFLGTFLGHLVLVVYNGHKNWFSAFFGPLGAPLDPWFAGPWQALHGRGQGLGLELVRSNLASGECNG